VTAFPATSPILHAVPTTWSAYPSESQTFDYGKDASSARSVGKSTVPPVEMPRTFLVLPTASPASIHTIRSHKVYIKRSPLVAKLRSSPSFPAYFGCDDSQFAWTNLKHGIDGIVARLSDCSSSSGTRRESGYCKNIDANMLSKAALTSSAGSWHDPFGFVHVGEASGGARSIYG
jgi:hypothetical protein